MEESDCSKLKDTGFQTSLKKGKSDISDFLTKSQWKRSIEWNQSAMAMVIAS